MRQRKTLFFALMGPVLFAGGKPLHAQTHPVVQSGREAPCSPEATRALRAHKAALFVFVAPDCPICNGYAPELNRVAKKATAAHIAFYLVYSDPDVTHTIARRHAHAYGYSCPILLDGNHALARRFGATKTPEAVLARPDGTLAYHGRIDDRYVAYGKARAVPTTQDLRAALDAVSQGKAVPHPSTPVVGCFIPDAK